MSATDKYLTDVVQIPPPAGGGESVLFHSSDIIIGRISPSKDSDIGSLPRRIFLWSWHWDLLFFNRLQQYTLPLTHFIHSQDTWSQNHVWEVEKKGAGTSCVHIPTKGLWRSAYIPGFSKCTCLCVKSRSDWSGKRSFDPSGSFRT